MIVGQETDGTVTPLDLGLDWMVSKRKWFIGATLAAPAGDARARPPAARRPAARTTPTSCCRRALPCPRGRTARARPGTAGHVTSSATAARRSGRTFALALLAGGRARIGGDGGGRRRRPRGPRQPSRAPSSTTRRTCAVMADPSPCGAAARSAQRRRIRCRSSSRRRRDRRTAVPRPGPAADADRRTAALAAVGAALGVDLPTPNRLVSRRRRGPPRDLAGPRRMARRRAPATPAALGDRRVVAQHGRPHRRDHRRRVGAPNAARAAGPASATCCRPGAPIDLHPRPSASVHAVQTQLARVDVIIGRGRARTSGTSPCGRRSRAISSPGCTDAARLTEEGATWTSRR